MQSLDFAVNQSSEEYCPLTLNKIFYVFANENYKISHPRIENTFILVSTLNGSGKLDIDGNSFILHSGDLLIFDADKANFNYFCTDTSWNFWWAEFTLSDKDFFNIPLPYKAVHPLNETEISLLNSSMEAMKFISSKTSSYIFTGLLSFILNSTNHSTQNLSSIQRIKKADKFIRENISTATSKNVADFLKLSTRSLYNLFMSELKLSPANYINETKLTMAKYMIETSDKSFKTIAEEMGYADQFTFSKSFKNQFGRSPSSFRNKE